jgi:hypothetical protein
MSIEVDWNSAAQTAVVVTYERPWNWSEFEAATTRVDTLIASVAHTVDIILDIRHAGFPPAGAVAKFREVTTIRHENSGKVIMVGLPMMIKGILDIMQVIYRGQYTAPDFIFALSIEHAHQIVADSRMVNVSEVQ